MIISRSVLKQSLSFPAVSEHAPTPLNLLVSNKVFDNAAKPVIRNGPKIGWKLDAWVNDKYVFPNQT